MLTHGGLDALNLCLEAVARPGDAVVVESPCFYAALQAIERLGLRAIEVPTHPREGVDLLALAHVLETQRPKACWLMTNFQNPLGCSLSREKKRELVDLLLRHETPLIEDDVYGELAPRHRAIVVGQDLRSAGPGDALFVIFQDVGTRLSRRMGGGRSIRP